MQKANGYIIYNGPSLLDGQPIIAVAMVGKSPNLKTGAMMQTYIIRSDIDPVSANKQGLDFSVCGDCPHKGQTHDDPAKKTAKNRSCYVTLAHGPLTAYKQYKAGAYPELSGHDNLVALGKGRKIRLGTFGDPAAVPSYIWQSLLQEAAGHTAYSHQSGISSAEFVADLYMQSADSAAEAATAWQSGRRTFRVLSDISQLIAGREILCPASIEAGKRTDCFNCQLCSGSAVKAKSIAIVAHGNGSKYVAA